MKQQRSICIVLLGIVFCTVLIAIAPFFSQNKAQAQVSPPPLLLYQANPQKYSWKVNGRGRNYPNNKNPYGIEEYFCSLPQNNAIDNSSAYTWHNICIPNAQNNNGNKFWPTNISWNGYRCDQYQRVTDGPSDAADNRVMNGGRPNSSIQICSSSDQRAPNPFLNITKPFNFLSSMCSNDQLVLAPRNDPGNTVCQNLDPNMTYNPQNYSLNQLACLLYIDDDFDITACKNGKCNTISQQTLLFGQKTSINVCSLFNRGDGIYNVSLKAYDTRGVNYGSSSFWLTMLSYGIPHSISGHAFNDINKNGKQDPGEPDYTGPITITSTGGTVTTNGGSYTINGIPSGQVTVSFPSLPSGYQMSYPKNGPPPSFVATVGPGCTVDNTTGGTCLSGDITNLNFAITNSIPWIQSACGDIRMDNGITNPAPIGQATIISNATCSSPGVVFSGDTTANFGQGQASSTNQVVGSANYPEVYDPTSTGEIFSTYANLLGKAQSAGITPTNLASICTLSNCTLPPNLPHGIYQANGAVALNAFTFPANQNYVFLINGTLTINGNIIVPPNANSSVLFATADNIIIPATVGNAAASANPNLSGIYSTDKSFILQSTNTCNDLRFNLEGTLIVNATRAGGSLQNNRDLCGNNPTTPTMQFTQRLDFVLNLPDFIRSQQVTSQEVAP